MTKQKEFKIYKHEYGQNLVNTLLRLGAEGYDNIVWDTVLPLENESDDEEEVVLLSKGEIELEDQDLEEILKGFERAGEEWEVQLSTGETIKVIGPEPEIFSEIND